MEKITAGSDEFYLIPTGISEKDNIRYFTITTELSDVETIQAFDNVDDISYVLEDGKVYITYPDLIEVRTITTNIKDGTKTIGIYFNQAEKDNIKLQKQIEELTASQSIE